MTDSWVSLMVREEDLVEVIRVLEAVVSGEILTPTAAQAHELGRLVRLFRGAFPDGDVGLRPLRMIPTVSARWSFHPTDSATVRASVAGVDLIRTLRLFPGQVLAVESFGEGTWVEETGRKGGSADAAPVSARPPDPFLPDQEGGDDGA